MAVNIMQPGLRVAAIPPLPAPAAATPAPAATSPGPATATPAPAASAGGTAVRVLSWNLRDCAATVAGTGERLSLHDAIAVTIAGIGPDLALLQEIQQDDEKGGDIALLQVALAKAGWSMPYQVSIETGGQDDLALFSRYPIRESEAVLQPAAQDPWPRPGLRAVVDFGAVEFEVYNFHFKAMADARSETARKAQAKAAAVLLRNRLSARRGDGKPYFAVLGGDFNTVSPGDREGADATLRVLSLREDADSSDDFLALNETWLAGVPTYADERWRSVTDHLIVSGDVSNRAAGGLSAASVRIADIPPPQQGIPVSDHRPVVADLRVR